MIIFSRKVNEVVIIGRGQIIVKIMGVKGNRVLIGFQAPHHIAINRAEIYERKMQEGGVNPTLELMEVTHASD